MILVATGQLQCMQLLSQPNKQVGHGHLSNGGKGGGGGRGCREGRGKERGEQRGGKERGFFSPLPPGKGAT